MRKSDFTAADTDDLSRMQAVCNAFEEMQQAQRKLAGYVDQELDDEGNFVLHRPECPVTTVSNGKDQLVVDLFASFNHYGLGWPAPQHAATLGRSFLMSLGEVVWEIADVWGALAERYCKPGKEWEIFEGRRRLTHRKARECVMAAIQQKLSNLENEMMQSWWEEASSWWEEAPRITK